MSHENFVENTWPNLAISIKITDAQTLLGIYPIDISPCYKMIQVSFGGHLDCSLFAITIGADDFPQSEHTLFKNPK